MLHVVDFNLLTVFARARKLRSYHKREYFACRFLETKPRLLTLFAVYRAVITWQSRSYDHSHGGHQLTPGSFPYMIPATAPEHVMAFFIRGIHELLNSQTKLF